MQFAKQTADGRKRSPAICDFDQAWYQLRGHHALDCLIVSIDRDPLDIAGIPRLRLTDRAC
jgi:hypothetical protein